MPAAPITLEAILAAAEVGEGVDWEFKSARGGVPGSLWETYSAMANTDGGGIVIERHPDRFLLANPGTLSLQAVPDDLERPEIVREVAGSGRTRPALMEEAVLELCRGRFWTVNQLAHLLNRNPAGLRSRYITPLVQAGKLEKRFPRQGNRPDQAYTTAEPDS